MDLSDDEDGLDPPAQAFGLLSIDETNPTPRVDHEFPGLSRAAVKRKR